MRMKAESAKYSSIHQLVIGDYVAYLCATDFRILNELIQIVRTFHNATEALSLAHCGYCHYYCTIRMDYIYNKLGFRLKFLNY